jgi:putative Holliday junction resolvase
MRYLAIDYGQRRVGLAVGDDQTAQAGPIGMVEGRDAKQLIRAVRRAVDEHDVDELVIGIPYDMDGRAGAAAKHVEAIASTLERELGRVVHRVDERLTSYAANEQMKRTGLTHRQKKHRRDALAAAAILRDFLENKASGDSGAEPG